MKTLTKNILSSKLKRFSLNFVAQALLRIITKKLVEYKMVLPEVSYLVRLHHKFKGSLNLPFFSIPAGDGDPLCGVFVILLFCVWFFRYPYPYKTEYKEKEGAKPLEGVHEHTLKESLEKAPTINGDEVVDLSFFDSVIQFFGRVDYFNLLNNFLAESWLAINIIFLEASASHGALFIIKLFESKDEMLCMLIYFFGTCYRLGVWYIVWCYFQHKCIIAWYYLKQTFYTLKYFFNKYIWCKFL